MRNSSEIEASGVEIRYKYKLKIKMKLRHSCKYCFQSSLGENEFHLTNKHTYIFYLVIFYYRGILINRSKFSLTKAANEDSQIV
jgi:hypothetical protein